MYKKRAKGAAKPQRNASGTEHESYKPRISKKKKQRIPDGYGKKKSKSKHAHAKKVSKRKQMPLAQNPYSQGMPNQYQQHGIPYQQPQQGVPDPYGQQGIPYQFNQQQQQQQGFPDWNKTAESDTYSVKSAEPFNPYQSYNDNDDEEKGAYPLEGISDFQLETKGTLPMKRLESDSSESESESNSQGITTKHTNDDMIDSESSHSLQNNAQSETVLGMDPNEQIQFNKNIQIKETPPPPPPGGITLIGSGGNEKVEFNSNIVIPNDEILSKENGVTVLGAEVNEEVVFKKYNDGDRSNIETMMGAMDVSEQIAFNNQYEEEGKRGRNDVLTDLQNIKNDIVNALPDPIKYDYDNPSHPKNNKKGVYNYADDMSTMYDKSNALMKSMDNTYAKGKKRKKQNRKKNGKSKSMTSAKELSKKKSKRNAKMMLSELEPGAMKNKSKVKLKAKPKSNVKVNKSNKHSKKSSWQSFFARNGL